MGLSQVQKQVSGLKNFVGMSVGKIWPWKKKSALWMVSNVDPKIYVFWREKSCSMLTQKNVKEIAYIFTCYQALLKARFFFIFVHSIKNNKRKETILEIKCLFYCKFIYLIQFFEYKKFCNAITKQAWKCGQLLSKSRK